MTVIDCCLVSDLHFISIVFENPTVINKHTVDNNRFFLFMSFVFDNTKIGEVWENFIKKRIIFPAMEVKFEEGIYLNQGFLCPNDASY